MGERTPLNYRYGLDQGRLQPPFVPLAEEYTFVLGAESPIVRHLRTSDAIEVFQDLNLTGVKHVRFDAAILQPMTMPRPRDIAGAGSPYVYSASLKFQEVLPLTAPIFHPTVLSEAHELFQVKGGSTLLISADGGAPQTVTFLVDDDMSAAAVANRINAVLGGIGAVASPAGDADDPVLKIEGTGVGNSASVRITGGSAYAVFEFPLGTCNRVITGHASDTLGATPGQAHLENGAFYAADVGRVLKVRGAVDALGVSVGPNNKDYIITGVIGGTPSKDITITPDPPQSVSGSFMNPGTFDGVYDTRTFYGGDNLSAIIAPDGALTDADAGLPIKIYNAVNPINNFVNFITTVQSSEVATLRYAIVDEGPGFDAAIVGAEWRATVYVDSTVQYTIVPERGRALYTHDIAVNVSKLTGMHRLGFKLELLPDVTI